MKEKKLKIWLEKTLQVILSALLMTFLSISDFEFNLPTIAFLVAWVGIMFAIYKLLNTYGRGIRIWDN